MTRNANFSAALTKLHQRGNARLTRSLARRFPRVPLERIEEGVQDAFVDAWREDRQAWFLEGYTKGGDQELYRRVYSAAWRRVRGVVRRAEYKVTASMESITGFDATDPGQDATNGALERELACWMDVKVGEAAANFGRRSPSSLGAALEELISTGEPVKHVAERHRLPRRYLAEASVWLRRELEARIAA